MMNKTLKFKISNILLCLYGMVVFLNLYSISTFPQLSILSKLRTIILYIMFFIAIIFQTHNIKQITIFMILFLAAAISSILFNADKEYILIALLMFSMSSVSPKKVLKCSTIINIVLLVVFILASKLGFIQNYIYGRDDIIRQSLGTIYPTIFSSIVFFTACSCIILLKDKVNILLEIICVGCLAIFIYKVTNSKNDMLSILFLLFPILIDKLRASVKSLIINIGSYFVIIISILSIFITLLVPYTSNLYFYLNKIFSDRLYFQNVLFQRYTPSFFGQYVYQSGYGGGNVNVIDYFYIDNSFTKLLFCGGIIFFIIYLFCYFHLIMKLKKLDMYKFAFILIIILVNGIVEESLIKIALNTFIPILLVSNEKFLKDFKLEERV